eukprot:7154759-Karenia_brevis.AAC.1
MFGAGGKGWDSNANGVPPPPPGYLQNGYQNGCQQGYQPKGYGYGKSGYGYGKSSWKGGQWEGQTRAPYNGARTSNQTFFKNMLGGFHTFLGEASALGQ